MEDRYADLGTIRLHYVEKGEGPLVVMLHGFPDFWYSWSKQIGTIADAGYRVVAPDMRGYNLSDKPDGVGSYDIDLLVDDVARLIDHLGEERAHVVGHDWGGIVAWNVAMSKPASVDRLAIVNTPHPGHVPLAWLRRPTQLFKSWYVLFFQLPGIPEKALSEDDYSRLGRLYGSQKAAFSNDDIPLYLEAAAHTDRMSQPINYYRAMARTSPFRMRARTRPIDHQVLVLWGEKDVALESHLADPPRGLVHNVNIVRFPDAGHWLHREKPDEVNRMLLGFLSMA